MIPLYNLRIYRLREDIRVQMGFYVTTVMVVFAEHTLFQAHSTALQICLYYDELELCNILGSKRSIHKIGTIFYHRVGRL